MIILIIDRHQSWIKRCIQKLVKHPRWRWSFLQKLSNVERPWSFMFDQFLNLTLKSLLMSLYYPYHHLFFTLKALLKMISRRLVSTESSILNIWPTSECISQFSFEVALLSVLLFIFHLFCYFIISLCIMITF